MLLLFLSSRQFREACLDSFVAEPVAMCARAFPKPAKNNPPTTNLPIPRLHFSLRPFIPRLASHRLELPLWSPADILPAFIHNGVSLLPSCICATVSRAGKHQTLVTYAPSASRLSVSEDSLTSFAYRKSLHAVVTCSGWPGPRTVRSLFALHKALQLHVLIGETEVSWIGLDWIAKQAVLDAGQRQYHCRNDLT